MTRKSRREIERALDRLGDDDPGDVDVETTVVEITADDVDEDGQLPVPDPEAPDGYELGPAIDTQHPAVRAHHAAPEDTNE